MATFLSKAKFAGKYLAHCTIAIEHSYQATTLFEFRLAALRRSWSFRRQAIR